MSGGRRRPPWLFVIVLAIGGAVAAGGFVTFSDQRSGTPGQATVKECTGGRKYEPAIRCTGVWRQGEGIEDLGVAVGRIEGAGHGDVGKTIDVRIHGSDHATKPSLGTPLVLWGLGLPFAGLALFGLVGWWRDG
ncbi:MAG: hypothetical protein HOQ03_02740 [Thermoleophilia bacterium]|nr:hypothetical protein [Thermoleophilia bacterium]